MTNDKISEKLESVIIAEIDRLSLMNGKSEAEKLEKAKEISILYRAELVKQSNDINEAVESLKAEAEKMKAEASMIEAKAKAEAEMVKANAEMVKANASLEEVEVDRKDRLRHLILDAVIESAKLIGFLGFGTMTYLVGLSFEDDHYLSSKVFAETRQKVNSKLFNK